MMAEKRSYDFIDESIDSSNLAKRPQKGGRRQGRGAYSQVSERANALKKGLGACWRCRYLKRSVSARLEPNRYTTSGAKIL